MKIYSNIFDIARPVARQIYVAPNSVYAIGIKVVNFDIAEKEYALKVFEGSTELTPMASKVDGFTLFQRTSPSSPTVKTYDVVYVKGSNVQHFELIDNTTDSTVFDIDQAGGVMDLPIATESVLGGIKVGENLTIEADGTLNGPEVVEYTEGDGISIEDGEISVDDTVALKEEIPTKTSELTNDSRFLQKSEAGGISVSDVEATNVTVSETAQFNGTVTVDVENFLDATTGERAIEQHTTHNFEVEYEDGGTESFTVWANA